MPRFGAGPRARPVAGAHAAAAGDGDVRGLRWLFLVNPPGRGRFRGSPPGDRGQMLNVLLIRLGEVVRAFWVAHRAATLWTGSWRRYRGRAPDRHADARNDGRSAAADSAAALGETLRSGGARRQRGGRRDGADPGKLQERMPARSSMAAPHAAARVQLPLMRLGRVGLSELRALGHWPLGARVGTLSVVIVTLAAATNYAMFRAFDLSLPPTAAWLLFVVLQIGGAPASTPGHLGVFHYLTVLVLTIYDVDRDIAIANAVALHAVAVGSKVIAGVVILVATRTPILEPAITWQGRRPRPAALTAEVP